MGKIIAHKEVCVRCKNQNGLGWTKEDEREFLEHGNINCEPPNGYRGELGEVVGLPSYCRYKLEHAVMMESDRGFWRI